MGSSVVKQKHRECDELLTEISELAAQQSEALCKTRGVRRLSGVASSFEFDREKAEKASPWRSRRTATPLGRQGSGASLERPSTASTRPWSAASAMSVTQVTMQQRAPPDRYPGSTSFELQPMRHWGREWQELLERPTPSVEEEIQKLEKAEAFLSEFASEFAHQTVEELLRDPPECRRRVSLGVMSPIKKSVGTMDILELPDSCGISSIDLSKPVTSSVTVYILPDEASAKKARQDCRSSMLAAAAGADAVSIPLCLYVRHQGFGCAVVAEPELAQNSLVYGSTLRGRRRLYQRSAAVGSSMRKLCDSLGLRGTRAIEDCTL
eukprot:Hpha_TRINITY_DN1963_c0_g2::TRINITY_DN1963_c0_g2_i1::g.30957::m.30957